MTDQTDLILGVDGGGSKTIAWLAERDELCRLKRIGSGQSGPSNCHSVGFTEAISNLEDAIEIAFADARRPRRAVVDACLALAGSDREGEREQISDWAKRYGLAQRLTITNDAIPLLYAAAPDGVGVALVSGTGSLAIGRNHSGKTARCGGWGGLFGDEGSGYQIAIAGLRAASHAADGRGAATELLPLFLDRFDVGDFDSLIPILYAPNTDRATIASLAKTVFQASALGDPLADAILDRAAVDLSRMVNAIARRLQLAASSYSLAITGGVLLHQPDFVDRLTTKFAEHGIAPVAIVRVEDAAAGALAIASQRRYDRESKFDAWLRKIRDEAFVDIK